MDESTNILVGLALFLPFVVIVLFLANKQNKEKLEAELRDQLAYEAERTRLRNLKAEQNRQERLTKDAQKIIRKIPPKIKLPEGAKLQELSLDIPNVRTVKGKTQIPSQSSFGSNYEVNISLQTCTCENFQKRKHFKKNSIARLCKHLVLAMKMADAFSDVDETYWNILELGAGGPRKIYRFTHPNIKEMYILIGESDEWLNIYARTKCKGETVSSATGPYDLYGWSVEQKRWSYHNGPAGASHIKKLLSQLENFEQIFTITTHL